MQQLNHGKAQAQQKKQFLVWPEEYQKFENKT